jgi:hypothetical protein
MKQKSALDRYQVSRCGGNPSLHSHSIVLSERNALNSRRKYFRAR